MRTLGTVIWHPGGAYLVTTSFDLETDEPCVSSSVSRIETGQAYVVACPMLGEYGRLPVDAVDDGWESEPRRTADAQHRRVVEKVQHAMMSPVV